VEREICRRFRERCGDEDRRKEHRFDGRRGKFGKQRAIGALRRFEYRKIPGATAKIPGDIGLGRRKRHHQSRRAEAALNGVSAGESVRYLAGHAFDGDHVSPIALKQVSNAGVDRPISEPPVLRRPEQDGARPAVSLIAGDFCACQAKTLAEERSERIPGAKASCGALNSVHRKANLIARGHEAV